MLTFLGGIITEEEYKWFSENCIVGIPFSSNTHQKSIIEALRMYEDTDVIYISPCGFYPTRFKKAFISQLYSDNRTKRIKSCNIPGLRVIYNIRTQIQALEESINNGSNAIIVYMPYYARMKAVQVVKKRHPELTIIVYVPDLIVHSYSHKGIGIRRTIVKTLRKIESNKVEKLSKQVDGYVYLAEKMKEEFGFGKPYIIQEAIYNIENSRNDLITESNSKHFSFTYCGKLDSTNGVDRLLNAFINIKNDKLKLNLCGDGPLLAKAQHLSQTDNRIVVYGQVSHDRVVQIEQESTVLVNPRYTAIENAAYSFPSKLIEYLACGRPVISSHLSGIPREYDDHVFYIEDDSIEKLQEVMEQVIDIPREKLNEMGEDNYRFVLENKSSYAQGKRMISFIKGLKLNGEHSS